MSSEQYAAFHRELNVPLTMEQIVAARKQVLDGLFWELTYWKTPDLYEELVEGEVLHPGIFQHIVPEIQSNVVLDVGAGSGRATFECLRYGAKKVYAVEPSPGLLRILKRKSSQRHETQRVTPLEGRFDAVPLPDNSVDVAISCSAFTALPEQGGESGLVELQRVTKLHGKIIVIWPRSEDRKWLESHGFSYVSLPMQQEMSVHFRSLSTALECAHRFYAHNSAVLHYLYSQHKTDVPFSIIGMNPPHEYCWRTVEKQ
jgi:ubiquinone/menaquinone biosynthesis C-methylase UbiE